MKKSIYDSKPIAIEKIGNGSFFYRWGIEEVQITRHTDSDLVDTKWRCYEVVVWEPISTNKITEVVIEAIWGNGVEEKYLNDYNAAQMGILDSSYIDKYKQFLQDRKTIKEQIDTDCRDFNIK